MKSSKYWKDRFTILEESAIKKGADYYDSLDRQYREAERRIESKISTWYQRFANNNNITLAEARRYLTTSELEELHWSVEEYIKHGKENAISQDWMRELENASAKVHISRLESLKLQLQQEVEVLYGNQVDGIDRLARQIYSEGYYHTAFEIQRGFNVGWEFASLDTRRLDKVISKPWTTDGRTFKDKAWIQKDELVATLHTELTQAIIRGDAPDRAIKTIAKKFDVAKSKAGRLVMTESAYFSSVAQKDCFTELDVEQFEIVATLDSHTSELCQGMDGKVQPMNVFEPGVTAPPFHPWCRTTTVPYFEDDEGFRVARGADGKTYYVPSNMKYADWKKSFVDGDTSGLQEIKPKEDKRVVDVTAKDGNIYVKAEIIPDDIGKPKKKKAVVEYVPEGYDVQGFSNALRDFRKQHINDDFESGITVNQKGEITKRGKRVANNKLELRPKKGEIFIHNHPNGSTFSYQDVSNSALDSGDGIIASTKDGDYYFIKTKDFKGLELATRLQGERTRTEWMYSDSEWREEWLKKNAEKFGYIFRFVKIK